jgi:hypothetical protein
VHAQAPNAGKWQRTVCNDEDGIVQSGGDQLLVRLTRDAQGYAAWFAIGRQLT